MIRCFVLILKKAWILGKNEEHIELEISNQGDAVLLPESAPNSIATVVKILHIPSEDWANLKMYKKANAQLGLPDPKEDRVVFMGNSITEFWMRYNSAFFQSKPYINRGIAGQTTAQMLIRFRPDVIDLHPKVVVIQAGTNDIAGNTGPVTLAQISGNIFSMAELAKANDIKVVLGAVLPATSYSWRPGIYPADKIFKLNEMIKAYAKDNNIIYLDYYQPMVDDKKGLKKKYARDAVHPNPEGYKVMEALVEKAIAKALKN